MSLAGIPEQRDRLPAGLLKRQGEESWYRDARREEGPRRLRVVARDLYRLVGRFKTHRAVSKMEEYGLLERRMAAEAAALPALGAPAPKARCGAGE